MCVPGWGGLRRSGTKGLPNSIYLVGHLLQKLQEGAAELVSHAETATPGSSEGHWPVQPA